MVVSTQPSFAVADGIAGMSGTAGMFDAEGVYKNKKINTTQMILG
jgi:uncharacterized protein (DUF362 family)